MCPDVQALPGDQTCRQPTLGPAEVCSLPVTVAAATPLEARFTPLGEGKCRLELGPPAPAPLDLPGSPTAT